MKEHAFVMHHEGWWTDLAKVIPGTRVKLLRELLEASLPVKYEGKIR